MNSIDRNTRIRNANIYRICFIIIGIAFLLFSIFFAPLIIIAIALFILAFKFHKSYKQLKSEPEESETTYSGTIISDPNVQQALYYYFTFKVAGVTFKNGNKTRQAILRAFKWEDEEIEDISFEPYQYEGQSAVYVKINDKIIGNVPADKVNTFMKYEDNYQRCSVDCEIYGGNKKEDGSRTNYGCEITIQYKS